ncbi:hypothetical protein HK101_001479 [Irineochytrium annulatum]|nr:hypothetical protein HK101_001479 [Irineochytrium annulatum]
MVSDDVLVFDPKRISALKEEGRDGAGSSEPAQGFSIVGASAFVPVTATTQPRGRSMVLGSDSAFQTAPTPPTRRVVALSSTDDVTTTPLHVVTHTAASVAESPEAEAARLRMMLLSKRSTPVPATTAEQPGATVVAKQGSPEKREDEALAALKRKLLSSIGKGKKGKTAPKEEGMMEGVNDSGESSSKEAMGEVV